MRSAAIIESERKLAAGIISEKIAHGENEE
jgi:hypothetical protein